MRSILSTAALAIVLTACQSAPGSAAAEWQLPSPDGAADYQLGGAYDPHEDVTIVVRDSTAPIADDLYNVCYVNGFQTQPAERDWWLEEHADAVLTDDDGEPVIDPGWPDEYALDTRTEASRGEIADVLADSIQRCADSGYDAVELDNLDSWTRFDDLTMEGNVALAELLIDRAHELGMAVAQKNAPDLGDLGPDAGFDFAISEECAAWDECGAYTEQYGDLHIDIEYEGALPDDLTFQQVCELPDVPHLMVYRDEYLVGDDEDGYVFELCEATA